MIPELLLQIESQMNVSLNEIRVRFKNSTNKGDGLEDSFRKFVRSYLPRNKSVGHGEIIDSFGGCSPQIDVVITYDHHPFSFNETTAEVFFIEGVAAIGEVKTCLTTQELRKTISSSKKTKKLKRFIAKDSTFQIPAGFDQRYLTVPPFFLFAYESKITLDKIRKILGEEKHINESPIDGTRFVDGIFVLERGYVLDFYPGSGMTAHLADGSQLTGWVKFEQGETLRPLLDWLYGTMYQMDYGRPYIWAYTGMENRMTK